MAVICISGESFEALFPPPPAIDAVRVTADIIYRSGMESIPHSHHRSKLFFGRYSLSLDINSYLRVQSGQRKIHQLYRARLALNTEHPNPADSHKRPEDVLVQWSMFHPMEILEIGRRGRVSCSLRFIAELESAHTTPRRPNFRARASW